MHGKALVRYNSIGVSSYDTDDGYDAVVRVCSTSKNYALRVSLVDCSE